MAIKRVVIVGAGGVGGCIAARLCEAEMPVLLVARGAHLQALEERGLTLQTPTGSKNYRLPATQSPQWRPGDVALLCVKSQDTAAALAMIPKHVPVACLQNGVENAALVAATHDTIAAMVWIMAVHLAPGEVALYASKCLGILDISTLSGEPLVAQELAELFCRAGFDSALRQDIMPWKRAKLLGNLAGIFEIAIDGYDAESAQALVAEGCAVLTRAKLPWTPMERFGDRVKNAEHVPIQGKNRPGGSLWQSKQRGSVSEAEYLNGYITRLGAMVGIPTPVNSQLLAQAKD